MFITKISQLGNRTVTIQNGRVVFVSNFPLSQCPRDPVFISRIYFSFTDWQKARDWIEDLLFSYYERILITRDEKIRSLVLKPELFEPSMIVSLEQLEKKMLISLSSSTSDRLQQEFANLLNEFYRKRSHAFLVLQESFCTQTNTLRFDHDEVKRAA